MEEIETPSFTLGASALANTRERIVKFNALAVKYGIDTKVELVVTGTRIEKVLTAAGFVVEQTLTEVTLTGTELKLAGGYLLAATLDMDAAGNIFRTNPYFTSAPIPEEFRTTDATRCDHCGTKRARKMVVLVWSETEGFKQVGSDCVRLFLGIKPEWVIAFADALGGLLEGEEGGSYGIDRADTVAEFVAAASIVVSLYGFRPASFDYGTTKQVTSTFLSAIRSSAQWAVAFKKEYPELFSLTDEVKAKASKLAAEAIAWIAETDRNGSDYIGNMKLAAKRELVGNNGGLLASLPNAFKRATEAQVLKAVAPESEYVGVVGDKITVTGSVAYTNRSDGYAYGSPESLFIIFVTTNGETLYINTTVATAVGELLEDAEKTAVFTLTATVKDHKVNNKGSKITTVTRAKAVAA